MLEQRSQLPVFQYKTALIEAVKRSRVIVVKGATGCGKTTQVCRIVPAFFVIYNSNTLG